MIYLLRGNNYNVNLELNKIITQLIKTPNEWNFFKYDLLNCEQEVVKEQILTSSFFSDEKIVVISSFFAIKLSEEERQSWMTFLESDCQTTIIFLCNEEKIDERTLLYKMFKKKAKIIAFNQVTPDQFPLIIKEAAKKLNFTPPALLLFIEKLNLNIERALVEIEKLSLLDTTIGIDEVNALIHTDAEIKSFAIADALVNRQLAKAISVYRSLPTALQEPISLIPLIAFKYRQVYQILSLFSQGLSKHEIAAELGINPYPVQLVLERRDLSREKLLNMLSDLASLDLKIKQGNYESRFNYFEMFLVHACSF